MYSWMDGWPNDRNNPLVLAEAECLFCRILELIKTWAILSAFRLFEHLWYLLHAGECFVGSPPSLWIEMILWSRLVYSRTTLDLSLMLLLEYRPERIWSPSVSGFGDGWCWDQILFSFSTLLNGKPPPVCYTIIGIICKESCTIVHLSHMPSNSVFTK